MCGGLGLGSDYYQTWRSISFSRDQLILGVPRHPGHPSSTQLDAVVDKACKKAGKNVQSLKKVWSGYAFHNGC